MLRHAAALMLALFSATLAGPALAQSEDQAAEAAAEEPLTAEKIIEVARERLRPAGVRQPCKLPDNPDEIVVCARDPNVRVDSSTDEAIRNGQAVDDGIPRAPNFVPPCQGVCMRVGKTPYRPIIVDLTNQPQPLGPEDAARVYRAEDGPPREPPPEPASEATP